MKIFLWVMSLLILSLNSYAQIDFSNFREGESRFLKSPKSQKIIKRALQQNSIEEMKAAFSDALKELTPQGLCGMTIVSSMQKKLKTNLTGALYVVRQQELIDDVVLNNLLIHLKALQYKVPTFINADLSELVLLNEENEKKALSILASIYQDPRTKRCLDSEFKVVRSQVLQLDKKLTRNDFKKLVYKAYLNKIINYDQFTLLIKANEADMQDAPITLSEYFKKISSVKRNVEGFKLDKSNFVTEVAKGSTISRRELLYQKYDYVQILTLANIIKEFKKFDDSKYSASVILYQTTTSERVIEDEYKIMPMDKFRYLLQRLIQKMDELKAKETFSNVSVNYEDLITASYELGFVVGVEVEEVAKLQDIWNPKKTFWEKASVWVRIAATASAVIIPPPYGFIPTLALVIIEATTKKSKGLEERPHTIF